MELHDFSDAGTSSLFEFDVANAHCFSPVDEAKLRGIIESGGTSDFNSMIREGMCTMCAPGLRSRLAEFLSSYAGCALDLRVACCVVGLELQKATTVSK
eukprot:COSAG02_NODE_200_length_29507_cov_440.183487_15_plen_99_part_00